MKRTLRCLLVAVLIAVPVLAVVSAQDYSEQDAIDLALTIPEFAAALQTRDDWSAKAYDTENAYGLWRVQFTNADGEDMGFADVNLAKQKIYVYDCYFGATDAQKETAQPIIEDFVRNNDAVIELMDTVADKDIYIDFDGYNDWWGVYIEDGMDSLYITVRFEGGTVTSLDNPRILKIYFPNVLSYDDWYGATSQQAIAVAFADSRVGDAIADKEGWTTTTNYQSNGIWQVNFVLGEDILAQVTVNLTDRTIINFQA